MSDIVKKPFHQTLVRAIEVIDMDPLDTFLELIETTDIPDGHEAIIAAIGRKFAYRLSGTDKLQRMIDSVREQKTEADARKAAKASQATDADKVEGLMKVSANLINLLQSGLPSPILRAKAEEKVHCINAIFNAKMKAEIGQALAP